MREIQSLGEEGGRREGACYDILNGKRLFCPHLLFGFKIKA